jgi:hypothetical protein
VREFADKSCNVILAPKVGGELHLPEELLVYLKEGAR